MNKIEAPEGKVVIKLPFPGFYESWYSQAIDSEEESFAEHEAEYRQVEDGVPEERRLDAREICDILLDVTSYSLCYREIAKNYVQAFSVYLDEELDIKLPLEFETMSSPKYYNFETDRIFAYMPVEKIKELREMVDGLHYREVIEDRHTSRDGFSSFYSADLEYYLEKEDDEFDHNELETLLIACINTKLDPDHKQLLDKGVREDWDREIFERMSDDSFYQEWEAGVDWAKYEEKVAEKRADKAEEAA
jgi:hypothetical protein